MSEYVGAIVIGMICIVLGALNMQGHIVSIHRHHRQRVSEADRIPFGKKVGLGTVICGGGLMLYGELSAISYYAANPIIGLVATGILIAALAVGIGIMLWAMIKYNKGIF